MIALAADELAGVVGGERSSTSVRLGIAAYDSGRSDYQTCVDTVKTLTRDQHPDTRPLGLFGTDRNARRRAGATLRNLREVCGKPAQ